MYPATPVIMYPSILSLNIPWRSDGGDLTKSYGMHCQKGIIKWEKRERGRLRHTEAGKDEERDEELNVGSSIKHNRPLF